jgi:hypothetical protein
MNCHKKNENRILEHQQKMCRMSARRLSIHETYKIYEKYRLLKVYFLEFSIKLNFLD